MVSDLVDPLAGYAPPSADPLAGFATASDRLRVYRSTRAENGQDLRVLRRAIALEEEATRLPPPLMASQPKSRPVARPPKHEPPPVGELADLIDLYRRRRDAIAQDQNILDDASLQALSIVVHAYRARYRCSTAEAAAVLRPLTIGAMG